MKTTEQIESRNRTWGFFGTFQRAYQLTDEATAAAFDRAAQCLAGHLGITPTTAGLVLDESVGRHLADQIGTPAEIEATIARLAGPWERSFCRARAAIERRQ